MLKFSGIILLMCLLAIPSIAQDQLSKEDTRLFMKKLATFVAEKHMRTIKGSMQHGMTYEYRDMRKEKHPLVLFRAKPWIPCMMALGLVQPWLTPALQQAILFTVICLKRICSLFIAGC